MLSAFQGYEADAGTMTGGTAIAFVPNIIGTAFDTTAAAPLAAGGPFVPWAAGGGVLNTLAQVGLAALWPLVAVVKYARDPVAWLALSLVALARPSVLGGFLGNQSQRLWPSRPLPWNLPRVG